MNPAESLPPARYESGHGRPPVVWVTGAGIVLGLVLILLIAAGIYRSHYRATEIPLSSHEISFAFENGPQASTGVARDWLAQDGLVHDHLKTYAWVDRPKGVVRIPIERAMELLADEAAKKPSAVTEANR